MYRKVFLKSSVFLFRGAVLLIAVCLLLGARDPTFAADVQMVKIQPVGDEKLVAFYIDPPLLQTDKNTIVVWISGIPKEDIQVIFMEGKTCKDVTGPAKSFSMNDQRCYVTSFMSFGETSSLQFVESGTYRYYVATEKGDIKAKGTIVVR